jgi:hypothetical protein
MYKENNMPNTIQPNDFDLEVWTEGKTDWKILKKALEKRGTNISIAFQESEQEMGDTKLLQMCKTFAEHGNPKPMVFIFDNDNKEIKSQVISKGNLFKTWGNNVFSFAIPIPQHRVNHENISIELYFSDEELTVKDKNGRRLFFTSEFIEKSGKHKEDPKINLGHKGILRGCTEVHTAKVIDSDVFDEASKNIALTKSDFANAIYRSDENFDKFDFSAFDSIIEILSSIASINKPSCNIYHQDVDELVAYVSSLDHDEQLAKIAKAICDMSYLALEVFCATTIRVYEDEIVNEPGVYRKKARPIKNALSEKFTNPNLLSLLDLTKGCYHIIDSKAPIELHQMKSSLEKVETLEEIGILLDDLQELFPPESGKAIVVDKKKANRGLFDFILPHLAVFEENIESGLVNVSENEIKRINPESWIVALRKFVVRLSDFFAQPLTLKMIESWDPSLQMYIANVRTYKNNGIEYSEQKISPEDSETLESRSTDLMLSNGTIVHLYPFLVIKDDKLYFYKKGRFSGFTYASVLGNLEHIEKTKRKFNHVIFKTGSRQELFWTETLPVVNPLNGIKANIPDEDELRYFVGRSRQKRIIREEIIEIPNQNGLLFGPGGIGKTALMIQLTKDMYNEIDKENILFENIVWISAKTDFFDYIHGTIEKRPAQFRSLEQALEAVLEFFGFDNLDEYNIEDKKYFVMETLKENRILLILDNFETVLSEEVDRIIRFFGVEVKRELRTKPGHFKVIITSRKQIPCGFHQLELTGLDPKESKMLMTKLIKKYEKAADQLALAQQEQLHEATKGIPIVIKHCFARLYEYNESFEYVKNSTGNYADEIIQFSFQEILQELEIKDKEEKIPLKILIVLELVNYSLMIRQIADILNVDIREIEKNIPTLVDYQCLSRIAIENTEKYKINPEIRLLTRALALKHGDLSSQIKNKILNNFTIDKQLDYSEDEIQLIGMFNSYLSESNYLEAENFIQEQLKKNPESIILKYYYAQHLKSYKKDVTEAIKLLESVREKSKNHPEILMLLVECYMTLEIPNFEKASVYANALKGVGEERIQIRLAEFYVRWSTSIKMKRLDDPFEERTRQSNYKDLASQSLAILDKTRTRTHHVYSLFAQSYFNLWDYDSALRMINKAIEAAEKQGDYSQSTYHYFRRTINKKIREYERQSFS